MTDKNGVEIKTGDIVRISDAYFESDNGIYFVANSPGDCNWSGDDYCLYKIGKRGKFNIGRCKTGLGLGFWPIYVSVKNHKMQIEADEWNKKYAKIEVIDGVPLQGVIGFFNHKILEAWENIEAWWYTGFDINSSDVMKNYIDTIALYKTVMQRLSKKSRERT